MKEHNTDKDFLLTLRKGCSQNHDRLSFVELGLYAEDPTNKKEL